MRISPFFTVNALPAYRRGRYQQFFSCLSFDRIDQYLTLILMAPGTSLSEATIIYPPPLPEVIAPG